MIRNDFIKLLLMWFQRGILRIFCVPQFIAWNVFTSEWKMTEFSWLRSLVLVYALVVVYGMHPLIVLFLRSSLLLLSCSRNFLELSNTCEYCYSNTNSEELGKVRNRDDSLGLAQVSLYLVCTNTHLCITGAAIGIITLVAGPLVHPIFDGISMDCVFAGCDVMR